MFRLKRFLLAVLSVVGFAAAANAAPVITVESVVIPNGGPGTFDISISNPDATAYQVGGFSLDLSTSGGLTFTGVNYPAMNYIYDGNSFNQANGFLFSYDPFPNTAFNATDLEDGTFGFTTLNPGDTFKLATVNFLAPPGGGIYPLTLANTTLLVDGDGNEVGATLVNGSVTVNGVATAVPEPATLVVFGAVAAVGLAFRRRKRAVPAAV